MPYVTSSVYVKSFGQKYLTPATTTVGGTPSHIDIFGFGGLKCFYDTDFTVSQTYIHNTSETKSSLRAQFGQVVYLRSTNKYYQCYNTSNSVTGYPQYSQLFALTTGSPSFPSGITISSGGIFVQSGNINVVSPGTISAGAFTASSGFYSNGILDINGNSSLGNSATNTTSVFGTLSIVNAGSNSGSITCDSSGNLVIDGSGTSGVQITDGLLYLGTGANQIPICSGSYIGAAPDGTVGAITTSKKVCADYGFANGLSDAQATFQVDSSGNLQCQTLKQMSLRQYKHDVCYITSSQLENIAKLKPMTFLYNQDNPQDVNDVKIRQAGFIAQQVEQIYPEVAWYKQGTLAGLQYQRLTAYLTRGIQQLVQQNKKLSHRLDLKDRAITKLNKRVTQLQLLMNDLLQRFGA